MAFTIELDNEFEHRMPHRTADDRGQTHKGPWLTSVAMWATCLRFIPAKGITIGDLPKTARVRTNLHGMRRWGYISIDARGGAEARAHTLPRSLLTATKTGRRASAIWSDLPAEIERRWKRRFGVEVIAELRAGLSDLGRQEDAGLPDCLPVLGANLSCKSEIIPRQSPVRLEPAAGEPRTDRSLYFLLSRVLLTYAVEYEAASPIAVAIAANILPHLIDGTRPAEIARRGGISPEACEMALTVLQKCGVIKSRSRGESVELTSEALGMMRASRRRLESLDETWKSRGGIAYARMANALLSMGISTSISSGRVAEGLTLQPNGWRAKRPPIHVLPAFPMVLHRGGYPDGA